MRDEGVKITMLKKVSAKKVGRIVDYSGSREPHEYSTAVCLASFGFDVEFVSPSNTPRSKNPDIEMLGTFWEMKAPLSDKQSSNEPMFRKAVKQASGRAVFDLRRVEKDAEKVERNLMKLFLTTRKMRRMIIIRKNGDGVDISK